MFNATGSRLLDESDFGEVGEALDYTGSVRSAWIVEPRHMFPPTYEHAVSLRGEYDIIFTHVRQVDVLKSPLAPRLTVEKRNGADF